MLSHAYTPEIRAAYLDFSIYKVYAPRSISAGGNYRKQVQELIITNWKETHVYTAPYRI